MAGRKPLTTTSYAILAHLAVQPWSAFELAKQMTRGLDLIWPRAESAMYVEPKNLVAHGLAEAVRLQVGKARQRTVYSITAQGRSALAAWLAQPPAPAAFESEALVRVFFAEHGSKEALLHTLQAFAHQGTAERDRMTLQAESYLRVGGPFPERWHLIALGVRFLLAYGELCERWGTWAAAEVSAWPATDATAAGRGPELLAGALAEFSKAPMGGHDTP